GRARVSVRALPDPARDRAAEPRRSRARGGAQGNADRAPLLAVRAARLRRLAVLPDREADDRERLRPEERQVGAAAEGTRAGLERLTRGSASAAVARARRAVRS